MIDGGISMKTITSRFCFVLMAMPFLAQCQSPGKTSASAPEIGKEYHPPGTKGGPMVFVPAGKFWMGCNDKVDNECFDDEKPYHQVYLDAFYIDKFEVTQGDYNQCFLAGKCRDNKKFDGFTVARQPVVGVTWDQAK
jgi:formylglycine-generating enzyme required for sulfatase activity